MGGTEVWINGTKVGRVSNVHFAPPIADTAKRVVVELEVLKKYRRADPRELRRAPRNRRHAHGTDGLYITAGAPMRAVVPAERHDPRCCRAATSRR